MPRCLGPVELPVVRIRGVMKPGDHLSADALHYLAGYVAFKLKRQHPDLGQVYSQISSVPVTCRMWLSCLSRGGLRIPSDGWFRAVEQLENDFRAQHGLGLRKEKNVIASLVRTLTTKFPTVPEAAIRCFIRTRTFIRMRYLNRQKLNTKKFVTKKMKKVRPYTIVVKGATHFACSL